jgi:hypothetical protein
MAEVLCEQWNVDTEGNIIIANDVLSSSPFALS